MIIGITGTLGAGKGTIAEYLAKKGFMHLSVRDFLVNELKGRGLEDSRDNMVMLANELREKNGPSFIAEKLYDEAQKHGRDAVIESIRAVGETEALRKKGDFFLFAVDADPKERYRRIKARKSSTDIISYGEFISNEEREMDSEDPNKQNLRACMGMADYTFINDEDIPSLYEQIEAALHDIKKD